MEPTPEELARRIAAGHSFDDHVVREGEFKDAALGPAMNIETREQFQEHLAEVLRSKETICFTAFPDEDAWRHADIFYHEPSNTMIIVPANPDHEATAYRPKDGKGWFDEKLVEVDKREEKFVVVCHGIEELRQRQEEERLLKIAEEREEARRKAREEGKGRSR